MNHVLVRTTSGWQVGQKADDSRLLLSFKLVDELVWATPKLAEDHAFILHYRTAVELLAAEVRRDKHFPNGTHKARQGKLCPDCAHLVYRNA